jgi:hypothetical protein
MTFSASGDPGAALVRVALNSGTLAKKTCYGESRLYRWMQVEVETYSGYRADERPCRFTLNGTTREVVSLEDRWYGPDDEWFRIRADDNGIYVLRHSRVTDSWTLDAFRAE